MSEISVMGKLRRFNGRDESVSVIGLRSKLEEVLKNPAMLDRRDLMSAVMSTYDGVAYGDANWSKLSGGWDKTISLNGLFANQYPALAQLNLDPALVSNLPQLMDFLKDSSVDVANYQEVQKSFSQHLGNKTVYRGMTLTQEEADNMMQEGITSDFLRRTKEMPSVIDNFEANVIGSFFDVLVDSHFHNENYDSPMISVTEYSDLAIALGRKFAKSYGKDVKKELYLFKINIPDADLIYYTDHGIRLPGKLKDIVDRGNKVHISIDGVSNNYKWDRRIESYVMHKINPSEIVEVTKPVVKSSSWNGRVTNSF